MNKDAGIKFHKMYTEKKEAIVYFSIIFVINLFGNNCVCECEISPSLQIIIIIKKKKQMLLFNFHVYAH